MKKTFSQHNFSLLLSNLDNNIEGNLLSNTFCNIKKIDKGGFGILYKAKHILDLKDYAIKKICLIKDNDDVFCLNIYNKLKEVRCLSTLNHKNIIRYNTSWIEKNYSKNNLIQEINIFIQMELMHTNLKQYLIKNNVNKENKNKIINNIILGIEYLHSQDIIHCDLKPDNILLNIKNKEIDSIKIADFGLVIEKKNRNIISNSEYGNFIYLPPESEYNSYTLKYDVYSLGIILFEIIEDWNTDMERIEKIMHFKKGKYSEKYPVLNSMIYDDQNLRPNISELKNINFLNGI